MNTTNGSYYKILTAKGDGGIATLQIVHPEITSKIFSIFKPFRPNHKLTQGKFYYGKIINNNVEIDEVILSAINTNHIEIHSHGGVISLTKICETIQQNLHINQANNTAPNGETVLWDSYSEISNKREHLEFIENVNLLKKWFDDITYNDPKSVLSKINELLSHWPTLCHARRRALVCMAGLPNAGKSSLMNSVSGKKRSLVSQKAKTTRDTITENFVYDGHRFKWIDTAGLHDPDNPLDLASVNQTWKFLQLSEIILWLHDAQTEIHSEELRFITEIKERFPEKTLWIIASKTDLLTDFSGISAKFDFCLSAETKIGVENLLKACTQKLFEKQELNSALPLSQKMVDDLKYLLGEVDLNQENFTILATYLKTMHSTLRLSDE